MSENFLEEKKSELQKALQKLKEVNEALPTVPMADWTEILGDIRAEAMDITTQIDAFVRAYFKHLRDVKGDAYMTDCVKQRMMDLLKPANRKAEEMKER